MMTVSFYTHDSTGRILSTGYCPSSMLELQGSEGVTVKEGVADIDRYYVNNIGELCSKPEKPSIHHVFDYSTKSWEDPRKLDEIKDQQWSIIKASRIKAQDSGFTWNGHVFDSDSVSQLKIQGAVQLVLVSASSGLPYSVDWTLKDNSTIELSGDDVIAVGVALATHVVSCHTLGRELREQLYSASSKEEVLSISWP